MEIKSSGKFILSKENSERLSRKLFRPVFYFDEINSTSTFIRENELEPGSLVIAKRQSSGRGRRGNSFSSPESGIYFSCLLKASAAAEDLLTVKAGLAVCTALEKILPSLSAEIPKPMIKWVNDIYLGDKKVCGILCEKTSCGIITGIGINLYSEGLDESVKDRAAGILDGVYTDNTESIKEDIIREIIAGLESEISADTIASEYRKRSFLTGKEISFVYNGEQKRGIVLGINDNCSLIVRTEDKQMILSSGEVNTIRKK